MSADAAPAAPCPARRCHHGHPAGARRDHDEPAVDAGTTLIELVVAMSTMSILMAVFTGAMLQLLVAGRHTESLTDAQQQLDITFARLDREIRYAAGIGNAEQHGAGWSVAYLTTHTGEATCTQLRTDTAAGQLQHRRWPLGAPPGADGWTPLASQIQPSATPFTPVTAAPGTFAQLRLQLKATGGQSPTSAIDITFTALNSTLEGTTTVARCTREGLAGA